MGKKNKIAWTWSLKSDYYFFLSLCTLAPPNRKISLESRAYVTRKTVRVVVAFFSIILFLLFILFRALNLTFANGLFKSSFATWKWETHSASMWSRCWCQCYIVINPMAVNTERCRWIRNENFALSTISIYTLQLIGERCYHWEWDRDERESATKHGKVTTTMKKIRWHFIFPFSCFEWKKANGI